jgi:transposase
VKDSKNGECKLLEGGNVTVVQGTRPNGSAGNAGTAPVKVASASPQSSSSVSPRNDSAEQKTRDSDSRGILESELKKAEAKQAELLKEYNNGEPDRNALEIKNPQRYVERLAEMKANIARNDSDIAGIKRELGRNQGSRAN